MLLLEDHFIFDCFNEHGIFFFFQWASLSLVEALKISEGGNALKHLISSSRKRQRVESLLGRLAGWKPTHRQGDLFSTSYGLDFSPAKHQRRKISSSPL